jgi:hypothetical protein
MEHRVLLTQEEAYNLSKKLKFLSSCWVKDEYTGIKRIRIDGSSTVIEKAYSTPVTGTTVRISSKCELGDIKDIWFEVKWTGDKVRFEVEFEGDVPEEYKNRPNIKGWDILNT